MFYHSYNIALRPFINILAMDTKEKELKELAQREFNNGNYPVAISTILGLEENLVVNFLLKKDWLLDPKFCEALTANENLLTLLLTLKRADELLFVHFDSANWKTTDTSIVHFHKRIAELNPSLFVKLIRITQAFLKSPLRDKYSRFKLSNSFKVHQSVWSYYFNEESQAWRNMIHYVDRLLKENLAISAILIESTLAIEFNYCKNRTPKYTYEIAKVYSIFIQLYFSKQIDKEIPTPELLLKEFKVRLSNKGPINESVELLFDSIQRWLFLKESVIIPYCFDLKIEPIEECGIIQFNRSAYDYYKWRLNGLRYDINRIDFDFEGSLLFKKHIESGIFKFKEDINDAGIVYETKCQTQARALQLFLDELELNEFPEYSKHSSVRFFQPLIAASNMFAWFYEVRLHGTQPDSMTEWKRSFNEMYEKKPTHLGIDNVPYLYLTPKQLYDTHKGQAVLENDFKTEAKTLIEPFSFERHNKPIDRFSLGYDVFKKPFFKLGEYVFCPIHFIAKNDWFYSIAQTALERMDYKSNFDLRKTSSWQMEEKLAKVLQNKNIFVNHYEDTDFPNEEMDVDVLISDEKDVVLMQIKRTKFRLNSKDAYFEYINSDRKASRQLNCAKEFLDQQKNSPTNNKRVHKWIVSTSYENVLSEINGCLKVNFSDVLVAIKYFESKNCGYTINDIVDYVEKDFQIRKVIDIVKATYSENFSMRDYLQLKGLRESLAINPNLNATQYAQLDLPLPLEYPDIYRQSMSGDTEYDELFNNAISADSVGDKVLSERYLLECLKMKPKDIDAMGALANVLDDLNKPQEAYTFYQQAICLDSDDPFLKKNYIAFLLKYGMKEEAELVIQELIKKYWFVDLEIFTKVKDLPPDVKEKLDLMSPSEINEILGL